MKEKEQQHVNELHTTRAGRNNYELKKKNKTNAKMTAREKQEFRSYRNGNLCMRIMNLEYFVSGLRLIVVRCEWLIFQKLPIWGPKPILGCERFFIPQHKHKSFISWTAAIIVIVHTKYCLQALVDIFICSTCQFLPYALLLRVSLSLSLHLIWLICQAHFQWMYTLMSYGLVSLMKLSLCINIILSHSAVSVRSLWHTRQNEQDEFESSKL